MTFKCQHCKNGGGWVPYETGTYIRMLDHQFIEHPLEYYRDRSAEILKQIDKLHYDKSLIDGKIIELERAKGAKV